MSKPNNANKSQKTAPRSEEIKPESVPENYVDCAEEIMYDLRESRLTTSKIRNLLSLVTDIYDVENLRIDEKLCSESISKINLMRMRVAYECGRDKTVRDFVKKAHLMEYLKGIGDNRDALIRFAHYMEALVAYHRYFGGQEG